MRGVSPRVALSAHALSPLQTLPARRWRPQWVCQSCRDRQTQRRGFAESKPIAQKPYYITTPIFYVNAEPHVGHMYTMVLTDVIKRWQELRERPAVLCTGTDEHGMKIQQAAAKAGVEPKSFCDRGAEVFKDLAKRINISNNIFIRTTDRKHREAVEYAWQMLNERGYIYESKHEGWYSVSDETFYPKSQVQLIVDPPTGRKIMTSVETGKEVEWTSERNYHFRLSSFRERLLEFYKNNPKFVVPEERMADVVREVTAGLEDLSISRPASRLTWGIPVPTDESQTIYVWLDALLNYASAVGYPFSPGSESAGGWPADVHVIGKDIVRFHCIYWPAFLMALELPLPKQVLTHAHWTLGRQKMAKSTGNVVSPFFALERFGTDVMRWYLVHDGGIVNDADYDNVYIIDKYRTRLQGGLGNLAARITRGKGWDMLAAVQQMTDNQGRKGILDIMNEESSTLSSADIEFFETLDALPKVVESHMRALQPNRALQAIMDAVQTTNAHMQHAAPWKVPSEFSRRINSIIFLDSEALRIFGILLQPFVPASATRLLDLLGVDPRRRTWQFCRVGADNAYAGSIADWPKGQEGLLFPNLSSFE